ncbi:MAG: BatD family protein [Flavobacteriaceae bacterium]
MNKNNNIQNITSAYLCVIILLFTTISFAQITTQTDTTKIRIGEQFTLKYIVDKSQKIQFQKNLQLDSLKHLEVIKSFDLDTIKNQIIKKYTLTSFDSGHYAIPPQLVMSNGKVLKTDSIWIDVSTVAVDTTKQKLFPIKSVQSQAFTLKDYATNYWYYALAFLALLAAIWYFFIRKKEDEEERLAKIPPFEMAIQELENLDKKLLWQNNKTKEYYSELTDIVRNFIEKELKVPALESTTNELVKNLKSLNNIQKLDISKKTFLKLKTLLQEADLVKFAKSKPFSTEIEMHRSYADSILEGLKSVEIIETEEIINSEEKTIEENVDVDTIKKENDAK